MRISHLADRSGIRASTLRYYETLGLIASHREPNGYRVYDESVLDRLSLLEAAKQLDLSLAEIGELLEVVESDTCTQVRETLYPRLQHRLDEVDRRLAGLRLLRDRLAAATRTVGSCPDSGRSCRSECMIAACVPQS